MTHQNITIRWATLADLDFVQQDHYLPSEVVTRKIEWQEVLVAEWNGKLVGYARIEYLWSIVPYLALIRVQPEYRRQGVGKALLNYLEEFLRNIACQVLCAAENKREVKQ